MTSVTRSRRSFRPAGRRIRRAAANPTENGGQGACDRPGRSMAAWSPGGWLEQEEYGLRVHRRYVDGAAFW